MTTPVDTYLDKRYGRPPQQPQQNQPTEAELAEAQRLWNEKYGQPSAQQAANGQAAQDDDAQDDPEFAQLTKVLAGREWERGEGKAEDFEKAWPRLYSELRQKGLISPTSLAASAGDKFDAALAAYQANVDALQHSGKKVYSTEEIERRVAAERDRLKAVYDEVGRTVQTLRESAEKDLLAQHQDTFFSLSVVDRSRMNEAAAFVKEDCAEMSLGDLARRIQAVATQDEKALHVLYYRYASRRLAGLREQIITRQERPQSVSTRDVTALANAVRGLAEKLTDPARLATVKRAALSAHAANTLAGHVATSRYLFDVYGTPGAPRR